MVLHDRKEVVSEKTAEPVTLLLDEGKSLRVIAELPGITEEKILIDLGETRIGNFCTPETGSRKKFRKVIALPIEVRLEKKNVKRGILDLTLEKISSM